MRPHPCAARSQQETHHAGRSSAPPRCCRAAAGGPDRPISGSVSLRSRFGSGVRRIAGVKLPRSDPPPPPIAALGQWRPAGGWLQPGCRPRPVRCGSPSGRLFENSRQARRDRVSDGAASAASPWAGTLIRRPSRKRTARSDRAGAGVRTSAERGWGAGGVGWRHSRAAQSCLRAAARASPSGIAGKWPSGLRW